MSAHPSWWRPASAVGTKRPMKSSLHRRIPLLHQWTLVFFPSHFGILPTNLPPSFCLRRLRPPPPPNPHSHLHPVFKPLIIIFILKKIHEAMLVAVVVVVLDESCPSCFTMMMDRRPDVDEKKKKKKAIAGRHTSSSSSSSLLLWNTTNRPNGQMKKPAGDRPPRWPPHRACPTTMYVTQLSPLACLRERVPKVCICTHTYHVHTYRTYIVGARVPVQGWWREVQGPKPFGSDVQNDTQGSYSPFQSPKWLHT